MTRRRYDLACLVDSYRDGWKLGDFLVHRFRYHPPATWTARLREGAVRVNGDPGAADRVVRRGDRVEYSLWHEEPDVDFRCDVLYEDAHVLAVAKSGNLPVHAGGKYIRNTLIAELRATRGAELRLAHRLDRETSGIVLLAKTRAAARVLEREFHARRVEKEYVAIVRGEFPPAIDVDAPIGRLEAPSVSAFRGVDPLRGKPARTRFVRLALGPAADAPPATPRPVSLVAARPESGRTNQIRLHARHAGHPVLGDKIYGVPEEVARAFVAGGETEGVLAAAGAPRQLLHCRRLVIRHPATGAPLALEAPAPADFARAWGGSLPPFGVSWHRTGPEPAREPPVPGLPSEGRSP
jgi:RluA family pseudouridine synthase